MKQKLAVNELRKIDLAILVRNDRSTLYHYYTKETGNTQQKSFKKIYSSPDQHFLKAGQR